MKNNKLAVNLRKFICMLCLIAVTGAFCSCGRQVQDETGKYIVFTFGDKNVYLDEVYIYARTLIESYEEEYGKDVWGTTIVSDDGLEMDVEEMARKEVISNIVRTKALALQAESYGISLTVEEEEAQQKKAENFFSSLTDSQRAAVGMEENTVKRVMKENALADKVYHYIMKSDAAEVSDEQARMTTFYDMFFECYKEDEFGNIVVYPADKIARQKENADKALSAITEYLKDNENMNITFIGYTYNLPYAGTNTMSKNDILNTYGQEVLDTLYNMENGQISGVVETEYGYHIFQMIALTDEAATKEYKEKLTAEAEKSYFENMLDIFIEGIDDDFTYSKRVNTEIYDKIEFE